MSRRRPMALTQEPGHLLRRAHQLAVATFRATHGRGITPVQYAILRALREHPGIDQVTLAEVVALDTSTTADIAVRLETKGWIDREMLARRQRRLTLTDEGARVLDAMLPRVRPMYDELMAGLDPAEKSELVRLLTLNIDAGGAHARRMIERIAAEATQAGRDVD
ncbi:MAG: MarR family transcriptional regulator [Burkholderiaceae bacterium]